MAPVKKCSLRNNYCESYSTKNEIMKTKHFPQFSFINLIEWVETGDIFILHIIWMVYKIQN